jgi:hypothetical protein
MPLISATWEVEIGGPWFEVSLSKIDEKPHLKNMLKAKGLKTWLKL